MKVALVLSGRFNNVHDQNSGIDGAVWLKEHIIKKYDADVFIHSWNTELEPLITGLYNPIYSTFQDQVDFKQVMKENNISQEYFDQGFNRDYSPFAQCKIETILSMLYSRKCALRLVDLYENKKKFKYDWVILCHFDTSRRAINQVQDYYVTNLCFMPETLELQNKLVSVYFNQLNHGLTDMSYYGNSEIMKQWSDAYDIALLSFQKGSTYEQLVTEGWPDSCHFDNQFDHSEAAQFSNEIMLQEHKKTKNLQKYPKWQCINAHILSKYIAMHLGLYPDKLAFTYNGNVYMPAKG